MNTGIFNSLCKIQIILNYLLLEVNNLLLQFNVLPASKCPKRDVLAAIDIYCKSVDQGSLTDTNQIMDYIWNFGSHIDEKRSMFFYILYDQKSDVIGFAEYAYLPHNQVLVLDYLCTKQRNHMLFYNFYHMVCQEITDTLKKKGQFIRYIITELSLSQKDGKLIDVDSNYFRHLLSNENYRLLKYPYYQPPLLKHEEATEFNIAIKLLSSDTNDFSLSQSQYLAIIKELYIAHYLAWFQSDDSFEGIINGLLSRIENELPKNDPNDGIALIQCHLFDEGQCPKFTAENITIPREKKKKWKLIILIITWILLSIGTFILSVVPEFNKVSTNLCSFLTILAGIISLVSFKHELFGTK